jgi:hypothetical protein
MVQEAYLIANHIWLKSLSENLQKQRNVIVQLIEDHSNFIVLVNNSHCDFQYYYSTYSKLNLYSYQYLILLLQYIQRPI